MFGSRRITSRCKCAQQFRRQTLGHQARFGVPNIWSPSKHQTKNLRVSPDALLVLLAVLYSSKNQKYIHDLSAA
jgi:hypothetical protein